MSDWLTVHAGDCRDVLPMLPDDSHTPTRFRT
jgi:hypothetical protein